MSESRSLVGDLLDSAATAILNTMDCYGWIVPATILTLLFIGVLMCVCWFCEDLPLEADMFMVPKRIFRWARKKWARPN